MFKDRELCTKHKQKSSSKAGWDNQARARFSRGTLTHQWHTPNAQTAAWLVFLEDSCCERHQQGVRTGSCRQPQLISAFHVDQVILHSDPTTAAALHTQPCAKHFQEQTQTPPGYLLKQRHCSSCKEQQAVPAWVSSSVLTEAGSP